MARLNVTGSEVRKLVSEKLATVYLAAGNTAGVAKLLNATRAVQEAGSVLHANRLHALLSDDVAQTVNERTVSLVDQAASELLRSNPVLVSDADREGDRLRQIAAGLKLFADADLEALAQRLELPRAVARTLVQPASMPPASERSHAGEGVPRAPRRGGPDWSYQDVAVARCLDAFRRRPNGRIGLVLPTGGGKTRTALKVILAMFRESEPDTSVIWVTHRLSLRDQAFRELQKLLANNPAEAPELNRFANRVKFMMLTEARSLLREQQPRLTLVVIDEAHHAAAATYRGILDDIPNVPVLMLTATPNRTDALPIGIDEIAFTITFRELAERGAVLMPTFEDFQVQNFDWSPAQVDQLATQILDESEDRFTKTLIIAPRIERIHDFYTALMKALPSDHPLEMEDIGYVHSEGNSLNRPNHEFLQLFSAKSRGIIVSAQLLLEGFDDPAINAVVITYPSSSVVVLMQAAGRCVRYAPGKAGAYVLQARNDSLEYHFDQRWLYQEISDLLRPQLLDIEYESETELREKVSNVLREHRVDDATRERIEQGVASTTSGELCNVFLYGLPYFGERSEFEESARWGATLENSASSLRLRSVFNGFCEMGANLSDPSDYLASQAETHGFVKDLASGSTWRQLTGLLTAAFFAKQEVYSGASADATGTRPVRNNGATTWLKYVTFKYRPQIPPSLAAFLADCHNRRELEARYLDAQPDWATAVKVPLPIGGFEGFLLRAHGAEVLTSSIEQLRLSLIACEPSQQVGVLSAVLASSAADLPNRLLTRLEFLLPARRVPEQLLDLRQSIV